MPSSLDASFSFDIVPKMLDHTKFWHIRNAERLARLAADT